MKPRTKLQVQVMELSKQLHDVTPRLLPWAKVHCLDHKGYATKSRVICMDCGGRFSSGLVSRKRATCPHCGTKITVEKSRKSTDKQSVYFAYSEIVDGFQVIRNVELTAYYRDGEKAKYSCCEVLQHWVLPNGKSEVVARNHTLNWYADSWNGDMEIRKEYRRGCYGNGARYDIYPCRYHPESRFKPEYSLYGINHKLKGLTFLEAIKLLPTNPQAETLLKAGQYNLLSYCGSNGGKISNVWPSVKICMRNKYTVEDAQMYLDYLNLLSYFDKDLHNAHYVCPKNLKKAHDYLMDKKRKKQEQEQAERKRKKAIEDEEKFKKLKARFFGISFSDKDIRVEVLESIREYMEEGDRMHHCVFTNEYYLKPDSLVFSASVNGVKAETVEVSLKQMKVVQSRGKCNQNTEYHDRIVKLVNKNVKLIRERMKAKENACLQTAAVLTV